MTPEQKTHAVVHNAITRALSSRGYWVPLNARTVTTETVLAALGEHGLVVVPAEDIRAVLGPKPELSAYIDSGRRLLAAVERPKTAEQETNHG